MNKQVSVLEEAINWLKSEDKSFREGVLIYERFGTNRNLLNTFLQRGEKEFRRLIYNLAKLADFDPNNAPGHEVTEEATEMASDETSTPEGANPLLQSEGDNNGETIQGIDKIIDKAPVEVQAVHKKRSELYTLRNQKQTELSALSEDEADSEKAITLADEITTLDEAIQGCSSQIRFFVENNRLPEPPAPPAQTKEAKDLNDAELVKKINNLRSQVSKAKKACELHPDNSDKKITLDKKELELERLESIQRMRTA
jgi:hypothetical protein